jgi:hypothetical protein
MEDLSELGYWSTVFVLLFLIVCLVIFARRDRGNGE